MLDTVAEDIMVSLEQLSMAECINGIAHGRFEGPTPDQMRDMLAEDAALGLPPGTTQRRLEGKARDKLLVRLRDGHIVATGRLSTKRSPSWNRDQKWVLHSTVHSPIPVECWTGDESDREIGTLQFDKGEYRDIRILKHLFDAFWKIPGGRSGSAPLLFKSCGYTPALRIAERSVLRCWPNGVFLEEKKQATVDWLMAQEEQGVALSHHLADAWATFLRPAEYQTGGIRRLWIPHQATRRRA